MKRAREKLTIVFLAIFLCGLLGLTGCKDAGKEEAVVEAAAANTELKTIKDKLADIISERDSLKLELTSVTETYDKLKAAAGQAANIKDQLAGLTKERDTAVTKATGAQDMIEKLKGQLAEQVKKFTGLQGQNEKLQGIIDELKKKLSGGVETPSIPGL